MYFSSVLQYNTPFLAIHLISLAIHRHFPCNTIFPHAASHCLSQYNFVYCNTLPAHPRCLIAIQFPVLQYNFPALKPSLAIQLFTKKTILQYKPSATKLLLQYTFPASPKLQYNALACNTIALPYNFLTIQCLVLQYNCNTMVQANPHHFVFRFFLIIFFYIISSYWKNTKKIYTCILFFFFRTSNKFLKKIYFL